MCNDYEQHVRWVDYCKMTQALELGIPSRQSELDLPQAGDVRINDTGPVMRAAGNEIELVPMTFSFPPGRPGGAPVFNFRSDGRHFDKSGRCLIPASAFFEFTGKRYPKAKHRFALKGSPITAIAGIWREGHGNHTPSFAKMLGWVVLRCCAAFPMLPACTTVIRTCRSCSLTRRPMRSLSCMIPISDLR
jgi:putative SOS response-associated peptidase YedK